MPTAPLASLIVHPSAALIPMPAENDPASQVVVASIVELGRVLEALKVCKGRVVDGRLRLRGAYAAGLEVVPVDEVTEAEITSIILHSLIARRHYTKSALAYLGFPLMEGALAESRKRRLANLSLAVSASKSRSSTEKTIAAPQTADGLAHTLGVSRSFFFMARDLHKKFDNGPRLLRETWEAKLLSGELSLGETLQAVSGKQAALEGATTPKGDAAQLLLELFGTATVRFGRWQKLKAAERKLAVQKFRDEFLPSLPPELLEEAEEFLRNRLAHA